MVNWINLIGKLKELGNPPASWLPLDYQLKKEDGGPELGGGRTLHDDWGIMFKDRKPRWWQPWQFIPRRKCAFAVPLPLKVIKGKSNAEWMPVMNDDYPVLPGTPVRMKSNWDNVEKVTRVMRHVETPMSIAKPGESFVSAAFIGGEWVPCYWAKTIRIPFTGKVIKLYCGLKIDQDGPMCWFPEVSASFKKF